MLIGVDIPPIIRFTFQQLQFATFDMKSFSIQIPKVPQVLSLENLQLDLDFGEIKVPAL